MCIKLLNVFQLIILWAVLVVLNQKFAFQEADPEQAL